MQKRKNQVVQYFANLMNLSRNTTSSKLKHNKTTMSNRPQNSWFFYIEKRLPMYFNPSLTFALTNRIFSVPVLTLTSCRRARVTSSCLFRSSLRWILLCSTASLSPLVGQVANIGTYTVEKSNRRNMKIVTTRTFNTRCVSCYD